MKIRDILKDRRSLSFEFYPPKTADGIPAVFQVITELKSYNPDFISVTYGAGGSTRAFTEELVTRAKAETGLEAMAHLTCATETREEVHDVLLRLEQASIENVIALRGDPPKGQTSFAPVEGGFAHATDLLAHMKQNFGFGLAAACYPETHVESPSLESDLEYSKLKVDLGAEFLITQLFYDNAYFFAFLDRARQYGITVPIIPGVLPILNGSQVRRFTALCGATIPPGLDRELERLGDDDAAVREMGIDYASRQVDELRDSDVEGIHFYVLNRSYSISRILENLSLTGHPTGAGT